VLKDEVRYRLLRELEANPAANQRDLARGLGVSVGKLNYCLRALVDKGFVKVNNFRQSDNKLAYAYLLTPRGIEEKARMTVEFLQIKLAEYAQIEREIAELRAEAAHLDASPASPTTRQEAAMSAPARPPEGGATLPAGRMSRSDWRVVQ
jgi:EPS-associated MarR family transcriptional regulator